MAWLGGGGFPAYLGRPAWHCAPRERGAPAVETRWVTGQESAEVIRAGETSRSAGSTAKLPEVSIQRRTEPTSGSRPAHPLETRTTEGCHERRESDAGGDSELPWIHTDRCPRTRKHRRRLEKGEGEQGQAGHRRHGGRGFPRFPARTLGKAARQTGGRLLQARHRCGVWRFPRTGAANASSAYRRCSIG